MQQNGQEQQEHRRPQQEAEQPEREGEPNSAAFSAQVEAGRGQAPPLPAEQQKTEECMDLLRRTQADFVNYRRRMSQEQAEVRIAAQSALLSQLVPVLDDLGRALKSAPQDLATNSWVQGLFLVARRLTTLLDQLGVRQIGTPGERFDPHWHEAISTEERADVPEGTIVRVAQPGYALGERVIRPAQVVVAQSPSQVSEVHGQHGDGPIR